MTEGVQAMPTFAFFKNGEKLNQVKRISKGLIRVKIFLKCDPRRFLIISRFFDMENTMQLLKNSGRSIFFDVNPICQPVTGCARNRKIFFWIS